MNNYSVIKIYFLKEHNVWSVYVFLVILREKDAFAGMLFPDVRVFLCVMHTSPEDNMKI